MREKSHLCRSSECMVWRCYTRGRGMIIFWNILLPASFWESGAWLDNFPEHLSNTQVVLVESGSVTRTEVI